MVPSPRSPLSGHVLRTVSIHRRFGVTATAALLALSGCGSDGDSTGATADVADGTGEESPDATGIPAAGTDAGGSSGGGTLAIEIDTGETWSLAQDTCTYTPDAQGALVELWGASADVPTGGGFVVSLFTTGPSQPVLQQYSSGLFDEVRGVAYTVANGDAVSDGSTMTMTLGMYATKEWELGDPIDLTATVTCQL